MLSEIIVAWFISHTTIASVLGDWFVINNTVKHNSCQLYKGQAHNLFGNICEDSLADLFTAVKTMQAFVILNLLLSTVYVFTTIAAPNTKGFRLLTVFVIFVVSTVTTIMWHTTGRSYDIPPTIHINYYGVGWVFQLVTAISCIIAGAIILNN